jgi:hypothetical protein
MKQREIGAATTSSKLRRQSRTYIDLKGATLKRERKIMQAVENLHWFKERSHFDTQVP